MFDHIARVAEHPFPFTVNELKHTAGGNLPGYHSQFSLNPKYAYGVIVLVTGSYADTVTLEVEAMNQFQPVFEQLLLERVVEAYTGVWRNDKSLADIAVLDGVLYLRKLVVEGVDILNVISTGPAALWSTGRPDEFR